METFVLWPYNNLLAVVVHQPHDALCVPFYLFISRNWGTTEVQLSSSSRNAKVLYRFPYYVHAQGMYRKTPPLKNRFKKLLLGSIRISLAFGLGTELNGSVLCRVACGNKTLRTWCWALLLQRRQEGMMMMRRIVWRRLEHDFRTAAQQLLQSKS